MAQRRKRSKKSDRMSLSNFAIIILATCVIVYLAKFINEEFSADAASKVDAEHVDANALLRVTTNQSLDETMLTDYKAMTISFNPKYHIPNWVGWELLGSETEGTLGRGNFAADPNVESCPTLDDYRGSGYDRGHMAPSADMKWDETAMEQCFYLTNMCPQLHSLNNGTWKNLEEKCRTWAKADSAIIIISGPVLTQKPKEYIGKNRVAVPQSFFKVILAPYANPPRGIGFIMPNGDVKGGLQACAVSIDSVESVTGHDFFSALPDSIEQQVEQECRFHYWSTIRAK
jgi:endonuclease G